VRRAALGGREGAVASRRCGVSLAAALPVVVCAVVVGGGPARGAPQRQPGAAPAAPAATAVAITDQPHRMAEPAAAVDPANPRGIVVAADPYRRPVRIVIATSTDGGASWGRQVTVLPPGFAKSYDPTLAFAPDGAVLVAGGASAAGRPNCQPGSAIFLARLGAGGIRYLVVRRARGPGSYADRPAMALDRRSGRAYLTWTESIGAAAECQGVPSRSVTMLATVDPAGTVGRARALPASGLPAPFGSAPAVDASGVLQVAVRERAPARNLERVVAVGSADGGASFGRPVVVGEGPLGPSQLPGLGGILASIPSISASLDGRVAVAWSASTASGPRALVAERSPQGRWRRVALPPATAAAGLWPTVAYGSDGTCYLVAARLTAGTLRFALSARTDRWQAPVTLASAPAGGYQEVGELLGLGAAAGTVVAAVPLDGADRSRLLVWRRRDPPAPVAPAAPSSMARVPAGGGPSAAGPSSTRQGGGPTDRGGPPAAVWLAAAPVAAVVLLRLRALRRRRPRR
jgi:hypothetical protein